MEQASPANGQGSLADELTREIDRLRQIASSLKQREEQLRQQEEQLQQREADVKQREGELAEMRGNYPAFKKIVYGMFREQFERELPPLTEDQLLEEIAEAERAEPFETFMDELKQLEKRS
jgi:hypothetical protein